MTVLTGFKRQSQLQTLLSPTTGNRRPLLTHLTADNSWLLSVPIPNNTPTTTNQDTKKRERKAYFHLLLDAWLTPTNAPYPGARWFQEQQHIEPPAYDSIATVINLIADIEAAAAPGTDLDGEVKAQIDAIVVGHVLQDHLDYDTLKQVDASVPVFAADVAFSTVQSWKHFETVIQLPEFGTDSGGLDWRTASSTQAPYVPSWLAVWRIPGPKSGLALHWGVCIVFEGNGDSQGQTECVVQSPHGLYLKDAAIFKTISPSIKPLALLHTTKESWFYRWWKANLGARNGVQVAEMISAKYWIGTHDELLTTTGINKWFLSDLAHNGAEIVKEEKRNGRLKGLEFVQIGNGESFLLT